jgi:hypothetical protein
MKTTKEDFDVFKTECHRLMDAWELNNYDVRFEHKDLHNANADIYCNSAHNNAVICLSTTLDYDKFEMDITKEEFIKKYAKHETIHLLLSRLTFCGEARWCTDSEFTAAEEELVRKLINII